jgi:cytidylate kinase
MKENYVITISHLLGSGGAYIGQELSKALSIPFVDRQILKKISDQLNVPESAIENREEKLVSFWEAFSLMGSVGTLMTVGGEKYLPSDKELFDLESKFIVQIAQNDSAIILGRGGRYILRDFPRRFSVFVYAEMNDRAKRVAELYSVSDDEARTIIEKNDRERDAYMKTFTKLAWLDLRQYDICINTSSTGRDNAVKIIKDCVEFKLNK